MHSKRSPDHHRPVYSAWLVSAGARLGAQEADACLADDDWLYAPPSPPPSPPEPRPPAAATADLLPAR